MTSRVDQLKSDIDEFNSLLEKATRQRSKDVLTVELRKLQTELANLIKETNAASSVPSNTPAAPACSQNKCYEVKLNNYGWDQTSTTVKLYVSLKDVQKLSKESVSCNFTKKSLDLRVFGLDNKNYHLPINNFSEEIDTEKSYFKVKTDMIVVTLVKKVAKDWSHVTGVEKRINESKKSSMDMDVDSSNPEAHLMSYMQKLYQNGDDEMKRMISQAWTMSQEKREANLNDFPSIPSSSKLN